MNDRELLEWAAKAAGFSGLSFDDEQPIAWSGRDPVEWSPLNDDGDALQLAVRLRMDIYVGELGDAMREGEGVEVTAAGARYREPYGTDDYAATRRAIVRAAAAIAQQRGEG